MILHSQKNSEARNLKIRHSHPALFSKPATLKQMKEDPNVRLTQIAEEILELSSEFYYLMPQTGYSLLKVEPLDNVREIRRQRGRVLHVLEFEVAERLILAARWQQSHFQANPLDYIYSSLGVNLRPLDPDSSPTDGHVCNAILQYIYNSPVDQDVLVESIFEVHLEADRGKEAWCRANLSKGWCFHAL